MCSDSSRRVWSSATTLVSFARSASASFDRSAARRGVTAGGAGGGAGFENEGLDEWKNRMGLSRVGDNGLQNGSSWALPFVIVLMELVKECINGGRTAFLGGGDLCHVRSIWSTSWWRVERASSGRSSDSRCSARSRSRWINTSLLSRIVSDFESGPGDTGSLPPGEDNWRWRAGESLMPRKCRLIIAGLLTICLDMLWFGGGKGLL